MNTVRKLQFYKRILIGFLAINVACLAMSVIVSTQYVRTKKSTVDAIERYTHQMERFLAADALLTDVQNLPQKSRDEGLMFEKWSKTKELLQLWNENGADIEGVKGFEATGAAGQNLRKEIQVAMSKKIKEINAATKLLETVTQELILFGALTFIFGIVLPAVLVGAIINNIHQTKKAIIDDFKTWLEKYFAIKEGLGPDGYHKAEFWAQIALLTFEQFGHYSSHPMTQFGVELSQIVRSELKKSA